ncbi:MULTISPECIES: LytR/AlgR family response regulator transcription factor [Aestuariibaculum]|uniref:Response regulator transcription factor n=1 Tax=Aestuariibaculum lutulentum TaxID=2920935 RepID=A0ABS9RK65_9FLAO|nr:MULTISPECIES: response regulator transcription factor [Aestuariibaculum]MCH4552896.1 response regulator transcription factor [Aestuariibaculum lutulentum]MCR8669214.1 response regulator transcription factor [Aestuariibaculum sp. M13]
MKHKCLIVDDEPPAIKVLTNYIKTLNQLDIVGTCVNAFQAIELLNEHKIDLMFLDINMPKLIGTDLLKSLRYPPKVIFTTAHKGYAIEAFDLDAIDYLLKPISFERFLKAVNKYSQLNATESEEIIDDSGFLYFRSDRKMIKIFLEEILYIESLRDYIIIHKEDCTTLKVKQTLSSVEDMLPKNLFIRIHRSFIISINKVTAFTKNDVEIGKIEIPFGKNYSEMVQKLAPGNYNLED